MQLERMKTLTTKKIISLCSLAMIVALIYIEFLSIQADVIFYDKYEIFINPIATAESIKYIILLIGLVFSFSMVIMSFKKSK